MKKTSIKITTLLLTILLILTITPITTSNQLTITTNTLLQSGRAIFGNTQTSSTSTTIENIIKGSRFQMGSTGGTADSITTRLYISLLSKRVKCAIYNDTGTLIATTQERTIAPALTPSWQTFTFTTPKPTLTASQYYYLVTWAEARLGAAYIMLSDGGSYHYHNKGYGPYPPLINFTQSTTPYTASIYCTYTETPNTPPNTPHNPIPPPQATNITITPTLHWTGGDPDPGDTVTYDVYFGSTQPPTKVISNQTTISYLPPTLTYSTTYYWQIVAWDNHGASTTGPQWSFTTIAQPNQPPYTPHSPQPLNHSQNISITTNLSWISGDPDPGDTVTYDIYFGTTTTPPLIQNNHTLTTYTPGTLDYTTIYYWQIVAWDNHGASTTGPLWDFTTIPPPNQPPYTPHSPHPSNNSLNIALTTNLSWTGGDPDPGDIVTYDIYLGTTTPPPLVAENHTITTYQPSTLQAHTQYYWYITAKDIHGAQATGPLWTFTTLNKPPYQPHNPTPANQSTNVHLTTSLSWTGGDPDNDPVTYNVFFGITTQPPLVSENQTSTTYDPGILDHTTTYYWRIIAWDNQGANTPGPLWTFTTSANQPPNPPTSPYPSQGATNVDPESILLWSCSDPDPNDTLTYDVYFGTTATPPLVSHNQTSTAYVPGSTLTYNTTYYWQIVAWDNHGSFTKGPLWYFTTEIITIPPTIEIITPQKNTVYFFNQILWFIFPTTLIIGPITIEANASDEYCGIHRVEFYINHELRHTTYDEPYHWIWNEFIGFFSRTITVTAYNNCNTSASASIEVWKFF